MLSINGQVGERVHQLVGEFAPLRAEVSTRKLLDATSRLLSRQPMTSGNHAGRQRIASLAASYFRHFAPPPDWAFLGAEIAVPSGRVDLAWMGPDGTTMYDELKTADTLLDTPEARDQVTRYLAAGHEVAAPFVGLRLLSLPLPRTSLWLTTPDVAPQMLSETPLWFEVRR